MERMIKALGQALLDFVYPPLCLHCQVSLSESGPLLCLTCAELLSLLEVKGRCGRCFEQSGDTPHSCRSCRTQRATPGPLAAALPCYGPAVSLIKAVDRRSQVYLAKGLASFMVAQIDRLNWPVPDLVVPVPHHWSHRLFHGPSTSILLARALASLLSCKVDELLRRGAVDHKETLWLRRGAMAANQTVLVVDTRLHRQGLLQKAVEAMAEAYPARIYGLALCKEDDS